MDGPVHPFTDGVTVMIDDIGEIVGFNTIKPGIFPTPLSGRPIAELELVHVYVVPAILLTKFVGDIAVPAQRVALPGPVIDGSGLTVMV